MYLLRSLRHNILRNLQYAPLEIEQWIFGSVWFGLSLSLFEAIHGGNTIKMLMPNIGPRLLLCCLSLINLCFRIYSSEAFELLV